MSFPFVEKVSFDTILDMFCNNRKLLVDATENTTKMREREITKLLLILGADIIISFSTFFGFAKIGYFNPALHFPFMPAIQTFKSKVL